MKETKSERGKPGREKEKAHKLIIFQAHVFFTIRVVKIKVRERQTERQKYRGSENERGRKLRKREKKRRNKVTEED